MPQLDTKSVTLTWAKFGALCAAIFDCLTVSDGVNGWAVLDFEGIDGEPYDIDIEHIDAAVSGTFDVSLVSQFTEQQLLEVQEADSLAGIAANGSYRKHLIQGFTGGWIRPLLIAGKQQFRVKFSTAVVTRVRVVIWYKPATPPPKEMTQTKCECQSRSPSAPSCCGAT